MGMCVCACVNSHRCVYMCMSLVVWVGGGGLHISTHIHTYTLLATHYTSVVVSAVGEVGGGGGGGGCAVSDARGQLCLPPACQSLPSSLSNAHHHLIVLIFTFKN